MDVAYGNDSKSYTEFIAVKSGLGFLSSNQYHGYNLRTFAE